MATISKSLRETVESNPNISEVHFNADGGHHLNVYPHGGVLYGRITETTVMDTKTNKPKKLRAPLLKTRIVESVTREQVLAAGEDGEVKSKKVKKAKDE